MGRCLINDKIESFIESLDAGNIPDVWTDAAYPTMEDLDGFLEDLKQRTDFLRDWRVIKNHELPHCKYQYKFLQDK